MTDLTPDLAAARLARLLNELTENGLSLRWVVEVDDDHIAGVEVSRGAEAPVVWLNNDDSWSVR